MTMCRLIGSKLLDATCSFSTASTSLYLIIAARLWMEATLHDVWGIFDFVVVSMKHDPLLWVSVELQSISMIS